MTSESSANEMRVSLRSPAGESGGLEVRFELPDGWSADRTDGRRLLLLPEEPTEVAQGGFLPNVIIEVVGAPSPPSSNDPIVLVTSARPDGIGTVSTKALSIDETSDGKTVHHLVGRCSADRGVVEATCTALEAQWAEVAGAFDQVVDQLALVAVGEGSTRGN